MKIVVLRGGALGDFLLTLPAVAGLRDKWPEAEIEMVVARKFGELVVGPQSIQAVRPIEQPGLATFYAKEGKLDVEWGDYFTEFDLTISYLFDPDEIFFGNWKRCGGTGEFINHDPRNPKEAAWKHLALPMQRLGAAAGNGRGLMGEKIQVPKKGKARKPNWVIHAGSGGASKCWPILDWVRELDLLAKNHEFAVTWLGGEVEEGWEKQVPLHWRSGEHRWVQNRPLPELVTEMMGSDLYLGHDSGMSHLAGWSGAKCGLLFGPTDPSVWAPPGERVKCWSGGGRWPKEGEWANWVEKLISS
jgi:heptosyltransferase-2